MGRNFAQSLIPGLVVLGFLVVALARVVTVDTTMPQGFDEPCHIAAGMKWLDQRDYTLDAVHPPLARYAVALPLYLAGERFPGFLPQNTGINSYCTELGNAILSDGDHYTRNLFLARAGILPFLCLAALTVFLWARLSFGAVAGCFAAILFLSLPSVLAFSGLAYTDFPTMCTQFACLFAFALWLKKPSASSTIFLGVCAGLAISSKLTSFLFLPVAGVAMLLCKLLCSRDGSKTVRARNAAWLVGAACLAFFILWGSYGFSVGHMQPALGVSSTSISAPRPSLGLVKSIARKVVLANPDIPAPDLIRGMVIARGMNHHEPESYLYEKVKPGGWWYFFPLAVALKTPLPFLILAVIGFVYVVRSGVQGEWSKLLPIAAIAGIFVATLFVTLRVGTRHVLVVVPLLSMLAGFGASLLWRLPARRPLWGRLALCLLLGWQAAESLRAQSDFLAYFNELAPADPSEALVKGCDLDCGQDVFRLSHELKARGVKRLSIGVCTSANMALIDLPPLDILPPGKPVTGWVAVSLRALKTGQFKIFRNTDIEPGDSYPDNALTWLEEYRPVAHVGKTILLYYIPEMASAGAPQAAP